MLNFVKMIHKKGSPLIRHFSKKPTHRAQFKTQTENEANKINGAETGAALLAISDSAVLKLLEYAKEKKILSYEELSDFLPEHITNSDKIEQVLALLEANNVQLVEEDSSSEEDESEDSKKSQRLQKLP